MENTITLKRSEILKEELETLKQEDEKIQKEMVYNMEVLKYVGGAKKKEDFNVVILLL